MRYLSGSVTLFFALALSGCGAGTAQDDAAPSRTTDESTPAVQESIQEDQQSESDESQQTLSSSDTSSSDPDIREDPPLTTYVGHQDADGVVNSSVLAVIGLENGNVASAADGVVHIWDPDDPSRPVVVLGEPVQQLQAEPAPGAPPPPPPPPAVPVLGPGASRLFELADGRIAAAATTGVHIFDIASPELPQSTYAGHSGGGLVGLVQLPDGRMASAGANGAIQVWGTDRESAEELFVVFGPDFEYDDYVSRYENEYPPSNVVWRQLFVLPGGELAARDDDGLIYSWDPASLNSTSAIVTSDGVKIWDLSQVADVDSGPPEGVSQVGLLDGGQFVLYADFKLGYKETLQSEVSEIFRPLDLFDPRVLAGLSDGRVAVPVAVDGSSGVAIGDPATDRIDFILKMPFSSGGAVTAIADLGDGRIAVNGSHVDDPIYVWDIDEVGN